MSASLREGSLHAAGRLGQPACPLPSNTASQEILGSHLGRLTWKVPPLWRMFSLNLPCGFPPHSAVIRDPRRLMESRLIVLLDWRVLRLFVQQWWSEWVTLPPRTADTRLGTLLCGSFWSYIKTIISFYPIKLKKCVWIKLLIFVQQTRSHD